jgi:hypothetical protein
MKQQRGRNVWCGVMVALGLFLCPSVQAQELGKVADSLNLVPADAATYSVSLRNREQFQAIAKSKAWAKFSSLAFVKMARQKFDEEWSREQGPLAGLRQWYEKGEGRQLVSLLGDLVADEMFFYGGKDSIEFLVLLQELNTANQFAPLAQLLQGRAEAAGRPETRLRFILQTLAANADRIKVPDGVIGFKLKDTKAAQAQLNRLEKLTKALVANSPEFKDRIKKAKIGGGDFQILRLDGQMVPWDMIPLQLIEENAGEFEPLVKKLKELKFTLSVGLRDNFVLVGFGEGTRALEALGGKARLIDRPELKPLGKFSDRRLTSIAYASKEARAVATPGKREIEEMFRWLTEQLKESGMPEEKQAKIKKDLKALAKDLQRFTPDPGAMLSFAFLTDKGAESYVYDWTKNHGLVATKPLTLLNHVGGAPIFYHCSRSINDPKDYETLVKWLKVGYQYIDEWALPNLPPEIQQQYQQFFKQIQPLLVRLDKATGKMLLPALADGQGALVLDAKLKSKQLHQAMPPAEKALPILEPAMVLGVSDAELLRKAFKEYRAIANEFIAALGQFVPGGIAFEIPAPETKDVMGGSLYYYPLQAVGLDPQITPTAGLSKNVAAFTISHDHAKRLLTKTPPRTGGPVKADQPCASAFYLDWAGLMDAVAPWADYGLQHAGVDNNITEQVQAVLEILKVFRSATGVTYLEGDVVVSHAEMIFRDLDR